VHCFGCYKNQNLAKMMGRPSLGTNLQGQQDWTGELHILCNQSFHFSKPSKWSPANPHLAHCTSTSYSCWTYPWPAGNMGATYKIHISATPKSVSLGDVAFLCKVEICLWMPHIWPCTNSYWVIFLYPIMKYPCK
jgi:hypothetical protein